MRRITVSAAIAAAGLAACHPAPLGHARGAADRPVRVAATLDCPDRVGDLSLGRRAADGASCSYGGTDGAQVLLTRMALTGGSAQAALAALDAQARAVVPTAPEEAKPATAAATTAGASSRSDDDDDAPPSGDGEHARLDLPGLHIDTDGDRARVSGFGQHVEADGDRAVVRGGVGGLQSSVAADDRGATVRTGGAGPRSVDAALILAAEAAGPDGWRSAGYVARGPLGGPLVVAQVRSRGGEHGEGDEGPFGAARRLVARNTHP